MFLTLNCARLSFVPFVAKAMKPTPPRPDGICALNDFQSPGCEPKTPAISPIVALVSPFLSMMSISSFTSPLTKAASYSNVSWLPDMSLSVSAGETR